MSNSNSTENVPNHLASTQKLLEKILKVLDDHKAEDIVTIDLTQKSTMGEYMVVASGTSSRHLQSLGFYAQEAAAEMGIKGVKPEGLQDSDWVLLDLKSIIVHLFRPETRTLYDLEGMWSSFDSSKEALDTLRARHHTN